MGLFGVFAELPDWKNEYDTRQLWWAWILYTERSDLEREEQRKEEAFELFRSDLMQQFGHSELSLLGWCLIAMSVLNFEIFEFPTGWMVCLCGGISFQGVCFVNLRFWVEVSWLESIAIGCFYESFAIEVFGFPHTALCWTYLVNGFC